MTVFGADSRVAVTDTTKGAYAAIVHVEATFADGVTYVGTGAMVDATHVLTAGHMIYSASDGGWATKVTVTPAENGAAAPYGSVAATYERTTTSWTSLQDERADWALVTVAQPIGNQTGWFDLKDLGSNASYAGLTVETAGYPGDLGNKQANTLYDTTGTIDYADRYELYSHIDVNHGQSGSPVWVTDAVTGRPDLLGIVDWGTTSTNGFARVNTSMINLIKAWEAQDAALA